jgi:HSP20 family protein
MNTYLVRRTRGPYTAIQDPFAISQTMDRVMRDAFGAGRRAAAFVPAVDLTETADAYRIEAALPGWKPEQIDISIEDGILSLKGEVAETDAPAAGTKVHVAEIRRTSFLRRFTLPAEVDANQAAASFENGVLTLEIPKAEVVKPKQIRIEVK